MFNINTDICIPGVEKNLQNLYTRINNNKVFEEIYNEVIKYMDEKIKNMI